MRENNGIKISHIFIAICTMCLSVHNPDNMWLQIPWVLALGLLAQDAISEMRLYMKRKR